MGKLRRVDDFLPPPEELFPRSEMKKITLEVDEATVNFFRQKGKQQRTPYQRMMREVLKSYAKKYS